MDSKKKPLWIDAYKEVEIDDYENLDDPNTKTLNGTRNSKPAATL